MSSHCSENPYSLPCKLNENQILIFKVLCNQSPNYLPTKSTNILHGNPDSNHSNKHTAPAPPTFRAWCTHLTSSSLSQVLKTISHITSTLKLSSVCPTSNVMFLFGSLLPSIPHWKEKEKKSNNHTHTKIHHAVLPYGNILGPTFKIICPLYNPCCPIVRASGASLCLTHLCIPFDTPQYGRIMILFELIGI